jgi:hypothetical protein
MASLQGTTINGLLTVTGNTVLSGNSNISPWQQLSHCPTQNNGVSGKNLRLHVRTPIPGNGLNWNPFILEAVGYHTYSGEVFEDFKAVINVNGNQGSPTGWYGSQIFANNGTNTQPFVYLSNNTYGGEHRVCFSVNMVFCCCTGNIWVRWFNRPDYWNSFAWATFSAEDSFASPVKQF